MTRESKEPRTRDRAQLERAVVLQLLRDDRARLWSLADLCSELHAHPAALDTALRALAEHGVLHAAGVQVWASPAARRLDELGLIAV